MASYIPERIYMKKTKKKIELYVNENQVVNAAIDRIVVELFNKNNCKEVGQAILLTGCSMSAGTTSTCISLSIAIANTKRKTLLVDCDLRKAIKYKKLNDDLTDGLADFLVDEDSSLCSMDDIIYETNVEGLQYIPCGKYINNATRVLCSSKMVELIDYAKKQYDCIIFDMPSLSIVPDAQVLFGSMDGIVLVSALGETRKKQIMDAKRKILPFLDRYYGMIINKVDKNEYRKNMKDYDYYFVNKKGEQKLTGIARKKSRESIETTNKEKDAK